jgi:hypothetical protein
MAQERFIKVTSNILKRIFQVLGNPNEIEVYSLKVICSIIIYLQYTDTSSNNSNIDLLVLSAFRCSNKFSPREKRDI